MKPRFITLTAVVLGIGLLIGVGWRQREIDRLRTENQRVATALESARQEAATQASVMSVASITTDDPAKTELLRLRNQVSQLMAQKQALAAVRTENESLQARLTAKGTNTSGSLPPGYLRMRDAQWVGMNTPENTLQSFFWALRMRDTNQLLLVLTPESAGRVKKQLANNPDEIFQIAPPGALPVKQETRPDGSIDLWIDVLPGQGIGSDKLHFRQINGEWRMNIF